MSSRQYEDIIGLPRHGRVPPRNRVRQADDVLVLMGDHAL